LKLFALMMASPGAILAFRDIILRLIDGTSRKRDEFGKMEFGGKVKEEAPPAGALLGVFAKCWQLPYCRPPIRKSCPIYIHRTKCWKERVGCMCEEAVVRHSMEAIIIKDGDLNKDQPSADSANDFIKMDGDIKTPDPALEKTVEVTPVAVPKAAARPRDKNVKIPHNPNLPQHVKVERCRNCVIYNEHQRKKYQLLAPIVVVGLPVTAYFNIDPITKLLNNLLSGVDKVMNNLSLVSSGGTHAASNIFSGAGFAQYIVIGCIVIIITTWSLRTVEYIVFKLKI